MSFTPLKLKAKSLLLLFLGGLVMTSYPTTAMTIDAEINGDTVRWLSAQSSPDDGISPSQWATPERLVPAGSFTPGGNLLDSMMVNMVGDNRSSVALNMRLLGMEYNSPEAVGMTSDSGGGVANVTLSGGLVRVKGQGLGNGRIGLSSEVTPFTHVRPIISLGSSSSIISAFRDANAPSGLYITQVSLPQMYEYERAGVRIRHNWPLTLTLKINYTASVMTSVNISSPTAGVITPHYYYRGGVKYASGNVIYNIAASGYFTNGLRLRMSPHDTGAYFLSSPDSSSRTGMKIPLSVRCNACDQKILVENGSLKLSDLTTNGTLIPGVNKPMIPFSIHTEFSEVNTTELTLGTYIGSYSILLEPGL